MRKSDTGPFVVSFAAKRARRNLQNNADNRYTWITTSARRADRRKARQHLFIWDDGTYNIPSTPNRVLGNDIS